jgi:O-antigen/teichoic acid export membrane protein
MMATNPIMTRVGTPLMAEAQNDKDLLRRVYLSTIRMTSSVNFPIYGAIAAFRHEITAVVFGANWAGSADLLGIMAIWGMFRSLGNPVGSLLYGTGNVRLALAQSLGVTILVLPTIYFGSLWGAAGVAWALTLFYLVFAFALWFFVVEPITAVRLWPYTEQWVTPFLVTALACALAMTAVAPIEMTIVRLLVGLSVGGVAYLALSWLLNRKWCNAIFELAHIKVGA